MRGRKATSNPTSPLSEPKRPFPPEENGHFREALDAGFAHHDAENHGHNCRHLESQSIDHIATVRGKRTRNTPSARDAFDYNCSSSSSCDHVTLGAGSAGNRRKLRVECDSQCPHNLQNKPATPRTKYRPISEREIPYSEYAENSDASDSAYQSRAALQRQNSDPIYQPRSTLQRENLENILYGSSERILEVEEEYLGNGDYEEIQRAPPLPLKQEIRQFSREPTCIDLVSREHENQRMNSGLYDVPPVPRQFKDPPVSILKNSKTRQKQARNQDAPAALTLPRASTQAVTSDWRYSVGEPDLTSSQYSPSIGAGFDSCTLKRMLQNLPNTSPSPKADAATNVFRYDCVDNESSAVTSECANKCPSNQCSNNNNANNITVTITADTLTRNRARSRGDEATTEAPATQGATSVEATANNVGLNSADLRLHKGQSRDSSYPDSGISGMTNDTAGSMRSGDSGSCRSARSNRSHHSSQQPGMYHWSR